MSKPLTSQSTFAGLAPPWSLTNLDGNFTTVWSAVNDVGTYANTLIDTGTANAMVANVPAGITFTLFPGQTVAVVAAANSTAGSSTLNVNATGAKTIVDINGNLVGRGGISTGSTYLFIYDGTNWRIQNSSMSILNGAYKAANSSRTLTTQSNDPELAVSLQAPGGLAVYEFNLFIMPFNSAGTGGIAWNVNYSGTVVNSYVMILGTPAGISGIETVATSQTTAGFGLGNSIGTVQGGCGILHVGAITVNTAGTFALSWAAGAASTTVVGVGSYLRVNKIG